MTENSTETSDVICKSCSFITDKCSRTSIQSIVIWVGVLLLQTLDRLDKLVFLLYS